ncbi:MAG: YbjN domain-containing protein, partial [Pseudomonadota bacterium]
MGALFAVRSEPAAVHFSLTIDVKPRAGKHAAIRELVVAMNERLWLGHFDFWADENVVLFRHTLPLTGRDAPGQGEIHAVLSAAIEAAERFIPAFNFMVWAGKTPIDAIAAVLFETDGEA